MRNIIIIMCLTLLFGCSTTSKIEYVELPAKIVKEYVYLKCKISNELLTTNEIAINNERAIEILKKIAIETNDRKRKLEAIRALNCIEVI